jgi:hypothetical protein
MAAGREISPTSIESGYGFKLKFKLSDQSEVAGRGNSDEDKDSGGQRC